MSSSVRRCTSSLLRATISRKYSEPLQRLSNVAVINTPTQKLVNSIQSSNARNVHSAAQINWVTSRDESREIMALWPDVVRDITEDGRNKDLSDAMKRLTKALQYNVPSGKKNRALTLVYSYRKLARPDQLTEENIRLVRILGWCVEMLQACFLVFDDIMDNSQMRRGQPCWYLQENVKLGAINDGMLLEHANYELLRKYFKEKPCYLDLVETLQQNTFKTLLGQSLDLLATFNGKANLNFFTMDRYNAIAKYKTAYYSFVIPVQLAMYFAGIKDPEMHRQAKTILLEMGHFFQVQDDYLDCFGDPQVTRKIGTDIKEGKCSWLAVVALQRVTPAQRKIFEECYGVNDPEKVAKIKQLYSDLGLQMTYSIYEEETYNLINTHIQQISRGLPHDLFLKYLDKIYQRNV